MSQPYDHIKQNQQKRFNVFPPQLWGEGSTSGKEMSRLTDAPKEKHPYAAYDPNWYDRTYISPDRLTDNSASHREPLGDHNSRIIGFTTPAYQFYKTYGPELAEKMRASAIAWQQANPSLQGNKVTPIYTDEAWFKDIPIMSHSHATPLQAHGGGTTLGQGNIKHDIYGLAPYLPYLSSLNPIDAYLNHRDLNTSTRREGGTFPSIGMQDVLDKFPIKLNDKGELIDDGTGFNFIDVIGPHEAQHALQFDPYPEPMYPLKSQGLQSVPSTVKNVIQGGHSRSHKAWHGLKPIEIGPHISEMKIPFFQDTGIEPIFDTPEKMETFKHWWRNKIKDLRSHPRGERLANRYENLIDYMEAYPEDGENWLRTTTQNTPTPAGSLEVPTKLASTKPYDHVKQAGGRPRIRIDVSDLAAPTAPKFNLIPNHPYSLNDPNWARENYGFDFDINQHITPLSARNHAQDLDSVRGFTEQNRYMMEPDPNSELGSFHAPFLGITSPALQHARVYGPDLAHKLRIDAIQHQLANPELQGIWTPAYGNNRYFKPLPVYGSRLTAYSPMQAISGRGIPVANTTTGYLPPMLSQESGLGDVYGLADEASNAAKNYMFSGELYGAAKNKKPPIIPIYNDVLGIHEAVGHGSQYDDINKALRDKQLRYWLLNGAEKNLQPRELIETGIIDPHKGTGENHADYSFRPVEVYPHISEMRAIKYLTDRADPSTQTDSQIDDFISFWDGTLNDIRKINPTRSIEDVPPVLIQNYAIDSVHDLPDHAKPEYFLQRFGGLLDFFKHPRFREAGKNMLRGSAKADPTPAGSLEAPTKLASAKPYDHIKQANPVSSATAIEEVLLPDQEPEETVLRGYEDLKKQYFGPTIFNKQRLWEAGDSLVYQAAYGAPGAIAGHAATGGDIRGTLLGLAIGKILGQTHLIAKERDRVNAALENFTPTEKKLLKKLDASSRNWAIGGGLTGGLTAGLATYASGADKFGKRTTPIVAGLGTALLAGFAGNLLGHYLARKQGLKNKQFKKILERYDGFN